MPMFTISETDHERIREAVRSAESNTSGEIVCYLVESSGSYRIAEFRAGVFGTFTAILIALGLLVASSGWGLGWLETAAGIIVVALGGALLGVVPAVLWPPCRRFFAGVSRMARTVRLQAYRAFVEEEVFATRDRTGILIFISVFEHRVEVLADKGINAVVADGVWSEVVSMIVRGIKDETLTDGLLAGIERCGQILHDHGVDIRTPDPNELPDDLRIKRGL